MTEILTTAEAGRLAELETVIGRGLETFVEVGTALAEVRDARLYRAIHGTFEDYCREQWGLEVRYANRIIIASQVQGQLALEAPEAPALASESQARELAKAEPEERADVWRETVKESGGKPTAKKVREKIQERREKKAPAEDPAVKDRRLQRERNARLIGHLEVITATFARLAEDGVEIDASIFQAIANTIKFAQTTIDYKGSK